MKKTLFAHILFFITAISFAQDIDYSNNYKPTITVDYLYGELKSPVNVAGISNTHYAKLSVLNQTGVRSQSFFNQYKSPNVGISALFGYLGKKDVFGYVIGVYPSWSYHFYQDKSLGWDINFGTGLAYFTTPYNKVSNPTNQLIGSHFSNVSDISTNLVFTFNEAFLVRAGGGILHYTNGHTAVPSIGINDFTIRLGMVYKPGVLVGLEMPKRRSFSGDTIWRKNIRLSFGRHQLARDTYPIDGPLYNVYGISAYVSKQFNYIHEVQIGVSLNYDRGYYNWIVRDQLYDYFKHVRASAFAIHVGHEFLLQHFGFVTDLGVRLYDPVYKNYMLANESKATTELQKYISTRVGLEYYPYRNAFSGQKLSIGMFLKTNLFEADFVELNMTYTF